MFLSDLSDIKLKVLGCISQYIIFVDTIQFLSFLFGFGTNYEFYKLSLMFGILGLIALLLSALI